MHVTNSPFGDNTDINFRGTGIHEDVPANSTIDIEIPINWDKCELTGLEIIGAAEVGTCQLLILDTADGLYSTIPNHILNQFGYNWGIAKDFYKKELPYNATLYRGMRVVLRYTNESQESEHIHVNCDLHEVKE